MIGGAATRAAVATLAAVGLGACGSDRAGQGGPDAAIEPDPLAVDSTPPAGSLDDLHARVFARRCSGQPGLCHNGQFEPNLSTPAMTYAYLVGRPGLEKPRALRVAPGNSRASLLVDKLRNRGVATQMPLGAEPLAETDIQIIEAWIDGGALRAPGATPAPVLNNPPKRPEIAIFDASGNRLDGAGPVRVAAGTTVVLRHTVDDFETADADIPFAGVIVSVADGRSVVLNPGANDPAVGPTSYDASGPMGLKRRLDYQRSWTIPTTLPLYDAKTHVASTAPASGQTLTVLAFYLDGAPPTGIAAFDFGASPIQVP